MTELAEEDPDAAAMVAAELEEQGEAVTPHPWCMWVWRAWEALSDDRQWRGGGMGPARPCKIPWSVVQAYAQHHRHDGDLLFTLVRAMDEVFIEWMNEQINQQIEQSNKGSGEG